MKSLPISGGINTEQLLRIATSSLFSIMLLLTGSAAGATGAVQDAMNKLIEPITNIGAILLFLYGVIKLIQAGISEESSQPLKRIGVAWGIAFVLQSYQQIQNWVIDV